MYPDSLTQDLYEELLLSPYVDKITSKSVFFTEAFKLKFSYCVHKGMTNKEIMKEVGLPEAFGSHRLIQSFRDRYKDYYFSKGHLNEQINRVEQQATMKEIQHENALLKQEIEFLKKKMLIIKTQKNPFL